MPRRLAFWLDPFTALDKLRVFLASRGRAVGRWTATRAGRTTRPLTAWLGRARARRHADERKHAFQARLELQPMDWRNPPSESIAATALPLAMTAATVAAAVYFASTVEAQDRATALGVAAGPMGVVPDTAVVNAIPVVLDAEAAAAAGAGVGAPLPEAAGAGVVSADDASGGTEAARAGGLGQGGSGGSGGGSGGEDDPAGGAPSSSAGGVVGGATGAGGSGTGGAGSGGGSLGNGLADGSTGSTGGALPGFGGPGLGGAGSSFFPTGGGSGGIGGGPADGGRLGGFGGGSGGGSSGGGSSGGGLGGGTVTGFGGGGGSAGGTGGSGGTGGPASGIFGAPELHPGRMLLADSGQAPVRFVANAGQWAEGIDFTVRGAGYQVALTRGYAEVALARDPTAAERRERGDGVIFDAVRLQWTGLRPEATAQGEGRLESVSNFLLGNDPQRWHTGVAEYSSVRYTEAWSGVDLVYRGADARQVEYDLVVKPGASPDAVGFSLRGADARVDEQGRLVLTTAGGTELIQSAPVVYQSRADGSRESRTGSYRLRQDGSVGFTVGAYDSSRALVIDPVLNYSTTLSGSGTEAAYGVAADESGNAFAVGYTTSADFPTSAAYDSTLGGYGGDAFVAKLNPSGGLVWSTYLGGTGYFSEVARGVALDPDGAVYVAGYTASNDFPTTAGAYQTSPGGSSGSIPYDAFLTKFAADGAGLSFSTYLGGAGNDYGYAVAVDSSGQAVVVGSTAPPTAPPFPPPPPSAPPPAPFPTTAGAFDTTANGGTDAFVTKFNSSGSALSFSTFLGASGGETAYGAALDSAGSVLVAGQTSSAGFPTAGAGDGTLGGATDAFLSSFSAGGSLNASTFYGGSGAETAYAVAVDATDRVSITGSTTSADLPVVRAVDASLSGTQDALVARFTSLSSAPEYATYQGATGSDTGYGVAVDADGRVAVVGTSGNGLTATRYSPSGGAVEWSTSWGFGNTAGYAAAVDTLGHVFAAGATSTYGGYSDAMVLKYGPLSAPVITTLTVDSGSSATDRLTNDTTPTVSGTSDASVTLNIYGQGPTDSSRSLLGTTTASAGGLWTYTLATLSAEGVYGLQATATSGGDTSPFSNTLNFTLDTTPPDVAVGVVSQTHDRRPPITVTASDLHGLSNPATVTLDVDLNGDLDYLDAGETGFATGLLVNGAHTFDAYTTLLTVGVTANIRARVLDLAGNEGTAATVTVDVTPTTWATANATPVKLSDYGRSLGAAASLLSAGDVSTAHALDLDVSPSWCATCADALVYHSQEATPAPVVQAILQSDNSVGVPNSVVGTLTWDGAVAGTRTWDSTKLADLSPGGAWVFGIAPTSGLATGRHTYSLDLFLDYGGAGDTSKSISNATYIANRSSSPYGAGWSFANTDALVTIAASGSYPEGVLRLFGRGGWGFYEKTGPTTYTAPAGDQGVLAGTGSGWTLTDKHGAVRGFDSSGRQTTWTAPDGARAVTYSYDGSSAGAESKLAAVAGPDGGVATFTYSGGLLSQIATAGGPGVATARDTGFTMTGTNLTTITDPAGDLHSFSYDGGHRMLSEQSGSFQRSFAYASGLADTYTLGADSDIASADGSGTGNAGQAAAGSWLESKLTDALGNIWSTWFDAVGNTMQTLDPDGAQRNWQRNTNGFVTSFTDALGRVTSYGVDGTGNVTSETRPDSSGASWTFGTNSGLASYTDYNGHLWSYGLDSYGRTVSATDPLGHITTYAYGTGGVLQSVTDALGQVATYLYDAALRPTGSLVAGAPTGTMGYDGAGNAVTLTDPLGNVTTSVYDANGRVTGVIDALGNRTTTVYANDFVLSTTDAVGNVTSYAYNAAGQLVATIEAYGTGLARRTTFVYDDANRLVATVDPLGHRTTSVLDAEGRTVATVDPLGERTDYQYDLEGELLTTVDALGRVTRYRYDLVGRQVALTDALGRVWTTVYDANSNVTARVDPLGHQASTAYDNANRLTAQIDALGDRTSYGYDAINRPVSVTDPLGNVTTTVYDARGHVLAQVDALGRTVTFGYDAADNQVTTADPRGNVTTGVYDALNRQVATVDALGDRATSVFDAAGRLTAAVDALGNRTSFVYDELNRQVATIDALGHRVTSVYDAADRLVASVDPLGNRATSVYDDANRMTASVDALGYRSTSVHDAVGNVVASVDALGRRTTYSIDALNRVVATTDPLGAVWAVSFDAAGRPVSSTDPLGHVTTSVYDDADRLIATVDALAGRATTVYDAASNVIATVDQLGNRTSYGYDALNRVQAVVDALNQRTTFAFDAAGNALATTDALGHTTTGVFDAANRQVATVDALGNRTTSVFDAAGNVVATVDPLGNRSTFLYDELNRVEATVDALANRATTTYDAAGNVRTNVDELGRTTTYSYDARNLPVAATDARGNVWTTQYDALARAWRQIDPLGHDTRTYFDAVGRAAESADQLGNRRTTVFDLAGNAVAFVDELGHRTTTSFDALNRAVATLDALSNRSTTVYDAASNVVASVDALSHRTTAVYDALNRVEAQIDALGNRSTSVYDAVGNVVASVDALGRRTTATFDARDRVVQIEDALGNRSTSVYDAAGNRVATIDALGRTTTTVFDTLNRAVANVDALGNRATSIYDAAGQVIASVDALGNRTTASFDAVGNAIEMKDALGNVTTSVFDAANRRTVTVDALSRRVTTVFDARGLAESVTDTVGTITQAVYDAAGNTLATVDGLGNRTTSVFDALNRVQATVDALGNRSTVSFDAVGNVATSVDGLGHTTTYSYDALNRQITVKDPLSGVVSYGYDAVGNRTFLTDPVGNTTTWVYDALNRATTETNPLGANATFAYDAVSQLKSETDRLGQRRDFGYDAVGRLTAEVWLTGGTAVQTQTWDYDAAGRMTKAADPDGTYTLAYDARGRVTSVQEPFSLVLTFGYDGVGNRTSVQDSQGGVTTVSFDARNRQTVEELGGTGVTGVKQTRSYTLGDRLDAVSRQTWISGAWQNAGTTTYGYDALLRTTGITHKAGSGAVLASYVYAYDAASRLSSEVLNGVTRTYSYDDTDQLTSDAGTGYSYDANGNRTNTGYATGTGNRITTDGVRTYTHDANGNVVQTTEGASGPTWVYGYDHRNQLVSAAYSVTAGGAVSQRVTFSYDAWGNKLTRDAWDGSTTTTEHYGVDGWDAAKPRPVGNEVFDNWADLDGANTLVTRRVFGPEFDALSVRESSAGVVGWYVTDRLGSVRGVTDGSGVPLTTLTYSGWGEVLSNSTPAQSDAYGFTGRPGDTLIGGWDHRVRWQKYGRFLTPDPTGLTPDTNPYRDVGNSPTNATDPSGLWLLVREGDQGPWLTALNSHGLQARAVKNDSVSWVASRPRMIFIVNNPSALTQWSRTATTGWERQVIMALRNTSQQNPSDRSGNLMGNKDLGIEFWSINDSDFAFARKELTLSRDRHKLNPKVVGNLSSGQESRLANYAVIDSLRTSIPLSTESDRAFRRAAWTDVGMSAVAVQMVRTHGDEARLLLQRAAAVGLDIVPDHNTHYFYRSDYKMTQIHIAERVGIASPWGWLERSMSVETAANQLFKRLKELDKNGEFNAIANADTNQPCNGFYWNRDGATRVRVTKQEMRGGLLTVDGLARDGMWNYVLGVPPITAIGVAAFRAESVGSYWGGSLWGVRNAKGEWLLTGMKEADATALARGLNQRVAPGAGAAPRIPQGQWRTVNESMSARARAYQQQVTGRTGESYVVDGVKFDGVNTGGLIDAKGPGYATFVRDGQFRPWYRGADALVDQARRQLAVANGAPITWHVAEAEAATAMQNLLRQNNITGITVVHTPVVP